MSLVSTIAVVNFQHYIFIFFSLLNVLEVIAPFKHFDKLKEFVSMKLPPGFPVRVGMLSRTVFNHVIISYTSSVSAIVSSEASFPPGGFVNASREKSNLIGWSYFTSCLFVRKKCQVENGLYYL
jgi:hypothetical protein